MKNQMNVLPAEHELLNQAFVPVTSAARCCLLDAMTHIQCWYEVGIAGIITWFSYKQNTSSARFSVQQLLLQYCTTETGKALILYFTSLRSEVMVFIIINLECIG